MDYISQYLGLQKLRLNEFADISFTHEVEDKAMSVPPMILITFVENAFKYGMSSNEPCFIHISLTQGADTLRFDIENSVFERKVKDSKQMGIENCCRRLSLLYPDRYRLDCGCSREGTYRVRLELKSQNV